MKLSPREIEKIMIYSLASVAQSRKEKGIKLNYPEAVSIIAVNSHGKVPEKEMIWKPS